jgi:hypothetical protein
MYRQHQLMLMPSYSKHRAALAAFTELWTVQGLLVVTATEITFALLWQLLPK